MIRTCTLGVVARRVVPGGVGPAFFARQAFVIRDLLVLGTTQDFALGIATQDVVTGAARVALRTRHTLLALHVVAGTAKDLRCRAQEARSQQDGITVCQTKFSFSTRNAPKGSQYSHFLSET